MSQLGGAPLCPVCDQRVYYSEQKTYRDNTWHKKCFKCAPCSKVLETGMANLFDDGNLYCNGCYRKVSQGQGNGRPSTNGAPSALVDRDSAECCPRCGKKVYFAEQQLSLGRKWHKLCFTCAACKKIVGSTNANDHQGELYCRACHGRRFGPKGYGFAGGAGTMLSMDNGSRTEVTRENVPHTHAAYMAPQMEGGVTQRPAWGGGDYCPRCSKQVFIAEKRQAAGNSYHQTCFTCLLCHKKLDSGLLTEKGGEVYCKVCYGKQFGPKGYGFGSGAGTLQMNV